MFVTAVETSWLANSLDFKPAVSDGAVLTCKVFGSANQGQSKEEYAFMLSKNTFLWLTHKIYSLYHS